jgi:hypothetical protein
LLDILAAAPGAAHFLAIVFVNGENSLEGFVAVLADLIVDGHGTPPVKFSAILPLCRRSRAVIFFLVETPTLVPRK